MDMDGLLSRVQQRSGGSKCWAQKLNGDALEFVRALHELDDFNAAEAARILSGELGVPIEQTSVRNHFRNHSVAELDG